MQFENAEQPRVSLINLVDFRIVSIHTSRYVSWSREALLSECPSDSVTVGFVTMPARCKN